VEHIATRSADGVGPIRQLVARAVLGDAVTRTNSRDSDVTEIEPFGELPSTEERQNAVAATPSAVSSSSSVIGSSSAG